MPYQMLPMPHQVAVKQLFSVMVLEELKEFEHEVRDNESTSLVRLNKFSSPQIE